MADPSQFSDDELRQMLAQLKSANAATQATAATHFGQGVGSGSDFQSDFGLSNGEMFRAGIGRGMVSVGRNAANLATWITNPASGPGSNAELAQKNELDQSLLQSSPGKFGNMVGQAAAIAPASMAASGAIGSLGVNALANPIARGAIEGGVQGLLSADPGHRTGNTLLGAGMGAAIPATAMGARKLAFGMNVTPEARMLRNMGVDLTPGQMNPQGVMNTLEQSWESVPVLGNTIKGARHAAEDQFQKGVISEVAAPGAALPKADTLTEALDNAYQSYTPAYDAVKNFPVAGTRTGIARALAQTTHDPNVLADDAARQTVANWLSNKATQLPSGSALDSGDLLELRSAIRTKLRDVSDDAQRGLLENAEQKLTAHLNSQLPPDAASALSQTDGQYAKYKILENAMRKAGDRPDGFTPSQLSQAIKEATDPGSYARGGGPLRDLSSAGAKSFQTTMPNTGGRNAAIALSFATAPVSVPTGFVTGGTKIGRALMAGETAPQQAMQQLIQGGSNSMTASQRRLLSEALQRLTVASVVQPSGTAGP